MGGDGLPGSGPSITLSWEEQLPSMKVDSVIEYEDTRPNGYQPRKGIEMFQPRTQRIDILLSLGYTYREINDCSKECDTIRKQRIQTIWQIQKYTFLMNLISCKPIRRKKKLKWWWLKLRSIRTRSSTHT